ncbi:AAA family ATPase [Mycobacterium sp. TNTM28]|uniref:AAA family ATPase n=1 Tax=[Mycobacterium] fortunisiensis TaxID=2600579 RepID=A0ABS6KFL5_9MYCO|nr:PE-PPE domain-containing protein [[Mycobacterium] fortunisiensis]MBU9762349.1 AAA family ATPase [[Mycobacterium] fortunisiensis]
MAVKHRRQRRRVKKVASIGAATATITALTVGVAPPTAQAAAVQRDVWLQSGAQIFPPPDQIPDLTGGLGAAAYNVAQDIGAQLLTAIVDNVNLAALAQAAGLDPESVVTGLLNNAVNGVVGGVLGQVPIDVDGLVAPVLQPVLAEVLGPLGLGQLVTGQVAALLAPAIAEVLGLDDVDNLGQLVAALGLNLDNPFDLSDVDVPGLNVVTTGWPFTLMKLIGVDLGWVPPFPNSVAADINNTNYLDVGIGGLLGDLPVIDQLTSLLNVLAPTVDVDDVLNGLPDLVSLRVPIVAGVGLGAFAAGAAYQQVVDDLPNQPGGANFTGSDPLLGSFTILPMLLIDNPGRANGGILARAYPLFRLLGIDTVTPDTQVQSSTDGEGLLNGIQLFGLTLGGANLIPIKVDATAEYLPLSDFAAWPNPFTMANNVAAGMFPTYILRNQTVAGILGGLTTQVVGQLVADLADYTANPGEDPTKGPKLNIYYTLDAQSLPLLEPTYLAVDAINLLTGANLNNPIGTALSPVLTSLVNLGYTDVEYDPATGVYQRTLDEADIPTAFGTLPADVDWAQVPGHLVDNLVTGIQKAIDDGLINQNPVPSPIQTLLGLLGVGSETGISPLDLPAPQNITTTKFEPQGITDTPPVAGDAKVLNLAAEPEPDTEKVEKETGDKAIILKREATKIGTSALKARERTAAAVTDAQDRLNSLAENGRKQMRSAVNGLRGGAEKAAEPVKTEKQQETTQEKKQEKKQAAKQDKKQDKKHEKKRAKKRDAA